MNQELVALGIVGVCFFVGACKVYRMYLASFLSHALLRSGQVKWAMKVRNQADIQTPCSNCKG